MDPWNLIKTGLYTEAVDAFTLLIRDEQGVPHYSNRGLAYLNLGDYENALADFKAANDMRVCSGDGYLKRIGVVHWMTGQYSLAVDVWRDLVLASEKGKLQYSDAAGGVESSCLLWFAGVRLSKEELIVLARRVIEKKFNAKRSRIENWPGPIAKFLLGLTDEESLRKKVSDVPILRERELCQVEFYVAVHSLQCKDNVRARESFSAAAELHTAILENEYYLARYELLRSNEVEAL